MVRFRTTDGWVWAVQMLVPFTYGKRSFAARSWIVGEGPVRIALTDEHFKERRAALEIRPRRVA